jgi:hypothetical protein
MIAPSIENLYLAMQRIPSIDALPAITSPTALTSDRFKVLEAV